MGVAGGLRNSKQCPDFFAQDFAVGPDLVSGVCMEAQMHRKSAKASFATVGSGSWWQRVFEGDVRNPVCFAVCSFVSQWKSRVSTQRPSSEALATC